MAIPMNFGSAGQNFGMGYQMGHAGYGGVRGMVQDIGDIVRKNIEQGRALKRQTMLDDRAATMDDARLAEMKARTTAAQELAGYRKAQTAGLEQGGTGGGASLKDKLAWAAGVRKDKYATADEIRAAEQIEMQAGVRPQGVMRRDPSETLTEIQQGYMPQVRQQGGEIDYRTGWGAKREYPLVQMGELGDFDLGDPDQVNSLMRLLQQLKNRQKNVIDAPQNNNDVRISGPGIRYLPQQSAGRRATTSPAQISTQIDFNKYHSKR